MKNGWWKILGVMLVIYSIIAGLIIPMNPGIIKIDKSQVQGGAVEELNIITYNTFFEERGEIIAWLKTSSDYFTKAEKVTVRNERELNIKFDLPATLPRGLVNKDLTLVVTDPVNGSLILPSAVFFQEGKLIIGANKWEELDSEKFYRKDNIGIPFRNLLLETIRNLYFHVAMWFAMVVILIAAMVNSILYLVTKRQTYDFKAVALTISGIVLGLLGLVTGGIWANYTWGEPWSGDVKQNMSAVALLIYCAYFVLRNSFGDVDKRARVGAVFNIFAFFCMIPLLFVIPRMQASLHPGSGGNPGFGGEDLDNVMRLVFYPSIVGWILVFLWVSNIIWRLLRLEWKNAEL